MEFNLADLYEIATDTAPDRTAVIAGDERRTYRELDQRANRFAHHLLDSEAGPRLSTGEAVAIYAWNRVEWLEAELGIYKARGIVININYRYVVEELRYMLENSDSVVVECLVSRFFACRSRNRAIMSRAFPSAASIALVSGVPSSLSLIRWAMNAER